MRANAERLTADNQLLENIIADLFGVLEGLRRGHTSCFDRTCAVLRSGGACDCGAAEVAAKIDAAIVRARKMRGGE